MLSYDDGWALSGGIAGVFTSDDMGFCLSFDDVLQELTNSSLIIELTAVYGSDFKDISFINVDKWGESLIEMVTRFLMGLIF